MASLGGMRSLAASISYLLAWESWDKVEWGALDSRMRITVTLEPRDASYWEQYAWHMAYNAGSYYIHAGQTGFKAITPAQNELNKQLYENYVRHGADIDEEGLQYLPNNYRLLKQLGDIYRDRVIPPDHAKAAASYLAAYQNGAMKFTEREAAYQMVHLPDRVSWERAYEIMKRNYDTGYGTPSIVRDLPILEERLNIPKQNRIDPKVPPPPSPSGFRFGRKVK